MPSTTAMPRRALLLAAAAAAATATDVDASASAFASPWTRGGYGTLSVSADASSYTFAYGATTFKSTPMSLANVTASAESTGTDPSLGDYDELALTVGKDGALLIRYFPRTDGFVFIRQPLTAAFPAVWPSFTIAAMNTSATRCLGWNDHYFFPGGVATDLAGCKSNGPLFLFDAPVQTIPPPASTSMVLSALTKFTSNQVINCPPSGKNKPAPPLSACTLGVSGAFGQCRKCALYESSSLLLARPSLQRSIRAFGAMVRQAHNTTRLRGPGVNQLSQWNDNQAAYSWWTVGPDQEVWGKPEDIYLKMKEGYDKAGIPIKGWEPDNNWLVTYKDGNEWGNGTGKAKNWIGRQWDYNPELYPSEGAFVSKLGNLSMTYYTNGFNANNSYEGKYRMVGRGEREPHPTESHRMYGDLIGNASEKYNMEMLFTDFLCYRGPSMGSYDDVPDGEEGEHMWLGGQAQAARDHGVEVQFCMALAHQILMSVEWPSVTNARVNGDGGLDVQALVLPSVLAGAVGLGWSKDNLRTADKCYNAGYYPNGTVKWPCGSSNAAEGTSGKYTMQNQQTILATLSLGPVGLADQLSSSPYNKSADITSNKVLVMATCAATGDLLQPSYPLTPVERMLTGAGGIGDCSGSNHIKMTFGCGGYLLGTYTAVPWSSSRNPAIFYTAVGFRTRFAKVDWVVLNEQDLAPMVDGATPPAPTLDTVPKGSFGGAGSTFAEASNGTVTEHVWWFGKFAAQTGCGGVLVSSWKDNTVNMTLPLDDDTTQVNIAPVINGVALLGEAGKVTAVSSYRFASVAAAAGGSGLTVSLRGKPGEVVQLLFAQGGKCVAKPTTIGPDGTATATATATSAN